MVKFIIVSNITVKTKRKFVAIIANGLKLIALPLVNERPSPRKMIVLLPHVILSLKDAKAQPVTRVYESWSSPLPFIKGSIPFY